MKQSKLMSLAEALLNVAIGYIIAVATQLLVFPIFGLQVSITDNLLIGAFFTAVSIARSFAVRRLFEAIRIFKKETDK
tara:strand:- start:35 stop:268 length:234 start_codon:yes stop_codon:yes gene_type:complete